MGEMEIEIVSNGVIVEQMTLHFIICKVEDNDQDINNYSLCGKRNFIINHIMKTTKRNIILQFDYDDSYDISIYYFTTLPDLPKSRCFGPSSWDPSSV